MTNTQAVLFDLDGTLADTALDLGLALNNLLINHGRQPYSMDELRPYASHGSAAFVRLGFGDDLPEAAFLELRRAYLDEYDKCFYQDTVLFQEINAMLTGLIQKKLKWGIITNKPKTFTDRLIPKLGFAHPPAVVVSGDTTSEAKPSTKPMFYACEQIGIAPEHCFYVGDAERDIAAGRNAGMKTVLVNWGYIAQTDKTDEWGADYTIDTPLALLDILSDN